MTERGNWIFYPQLGDYVYVCSKCGFVLDSDLLKESNFCPRCGADMRIESVEPVEMNWINAKEKMPESGKRYLVQIIEPLFGSKIIDIIRYDSGIWTYDGMPVQANVTHWMPLPEPPKEA